jgi:hypothetical protein
MAMSEPQAPRPASAAPREAVTARTGTDGATGTWIIAQPTVAQERSGDPVADSRFHVELARAWARRTDRSALTGVLLSERLARRRGPGGESVARAWSDTGASVAVMADHDPRGQNDSRQLLVDNTSAVRDWGSQVRQLGADLGCWHAVVDESGAFAPTRAELLTGLLDGGLSPMLRVSLPGTSLLHDEGLERLRDLLARLAESRCDVAQLTLCLSMSVPTSTAFDAMQTRASQLIGGLVTAVPAQVRQVLLVSRQGHPLVGEYEASGIARATAELLPPWPISYSAGELALRHAAAWWQVPGLTGLAPVRFNAVLTRLARPPGHPGSSEPGPGLQDPGQEGGTVGQAPGQRRSFDTSLFRTRSLYTSRKSPLA